MDKTVRKSMPQALIVVFLIIMTMIIFTTTAYAQDNQPATEFVYYDELTVSAYYPAEDAAHPNNYKGVPLSELVGDIVAAPTGSDLIGKHIIIVYEHEGETEYMLRRVEDTGCKKGRIDLLVENEAAMREWGLKQASIYVIEE